MKVPGWIEKLYVDYLGVEIDEGQALFEYYSPALYAAQEEFLLAYRNKSRIAAEFVPQAAQGAQDLFEAARTRLEYFDVSPQQIEELIAAGVPSKTMTIHSPHKGVVIAKHANEGMRVDLGMQVYRIADLSKLWVMVTLYEYQLPFVQVGQRAMMSLPYIPGQTFEGEVIYIYPYLDEKTRQVNVRLEFDNPDGVLKPGMYTNVELKNTLARDRTLAPRAAIIDTGERQVTFVSLGQGKFEPRDVRTGIETDEGMVEILDGLRPGELVVTSGQFLLDSEANIREGLAKFVHGDLASDQETAVVVAGASELSSLPAEAVEAIGEILDAYFAIGDTLSRDSTDGISLDARALAQGVDRLLKITLPNDEHFWHRHDEAATVRGKSLELIDQSDIEQARLAFADLSVALSKLTRATGIPPAYSTEVHELHCPMFREGQGGSIWLQPKGDVRNPFFGSQMLECFDERSVLPMTGATSRPEEDPPPAQDEPATSQPAQEHSATVGLGADAQANLDQLVSAYLSIHERLTRDETTRITANLGVIHEAAMVLANVEDESVSGAANTIMEAANEPAEEIDAIRGVFERVSEALMELAAVAGPSESAAPTLYLVYCPMVKKNWLQATDVVANPYAPSMLRCGTVKGTISADNAKASNP
ncbi:MAG: efflux RND transporter periplasmic adaptor subunit, partial [Phycisphaerales bacterium]